MTKTLLVASREFMENIKTKGFWIMILSFPLLLTAGVVVPALFEKGRAIRTYAILDQSGWLAAAADERALSEDLRDVLRFVRADAQSGARKLPLLPPELRRLATSLIGTTDETLTNLAAAIGGEPPVASGASDAPASVTLPPELAAAAASDGPAIVEWLRRVEPTEARRLGLPIRKARYARAEIAAGTGQDPEQWLKTELDAGRLFAYFVVGPDPVKGSEGMKYVAKNLTDDSLREWYERIATEEVRTRRFAQEGVSPQATLHIQQPITFDVRQVAAGEETGVRTTDKLRQWAPAMFVYLLWIAIFVTANPLLTNTIEEKSNRIIEVLLSSVSPLQLMTGKILGIAAMGLTLILSWCGCLLGILAVVTAFLGPSSKLDLGSILSDPRFLVSFVVYFLFGYLFYAALLVSIGAVCNSLKEAQNLMQPVTMLLVVPLMAMIPVTKDPNGTIAKVLSYIPPFTPFVMMNRAAGPPAFHEYVISSVLLIAATAAMFWIAAKVFRIGVLMTGQPPKIRDIVRWIRTPVGSNPDTLDRGALDSRK